MKKILEKLNNLKNWFVKSHLWVKIVIIVLLIGVGWLTYSKVIKPNTQETQYQTTKAEKATIVESVSASGTVSLTNNASVITQVTGKVTEIYAKNGDAIKAGAPILEIELDQDSNQSYSQALSSYQSAKNSLESAKTNKNSLKSGMISAEQIYKKQVLDKGKETDEDNPTVMQLKADMKAAQQKYENQDNVIAQAQTSLNSAYYAFQQLSPTIYAPISGTVTGMSLQLGSVISAQAGSNQTKPSQKVANITTIAFPTVSLDLTEIDVPKIRLGQNAVLSFDALPDKTYTGKVSSIDTLGSVSSGVTTYPTTITLDVEVPEIYANMSCNASIIIDSKDNVLSVPTNAVQSRQGQPYVRLYDKGKITEVNVETGISSDSNIEIVSGISDGDDVVTSVINSTTTTGQTSSPFGIFRTGGGGQRIRD